VSALYGPNVVAHQGITIAYISACFSWHLVRSAVCATAVVVDKPLTGAIGEVRRAAMVFKHH
jgi:hypothetical protein